ncbi:MAG: methyltransferase domain-containing protein [Dehalococcoidia bacterium]|nr:methyltransferase domain-containing protein [Dehalococcoidia bacterium]
MNPPSQDSLTPTERRWRELAPPEAAASARGLYERVALWSSGNLPGVDAAYDPLREQHWAYAALVADFASHLPVGGVEGRTRVLDLGPGDGWPSISLAAALPGSAVLGVDPSPRRVAVCRANAARLGVGNASFLAGDGAALPVADGALDLAVASHSLEECADPEAAMRELARVLRPGGVLRVQSQVWALPSPEMETVTLTEGVDSLLFTYARRTQEPARERRYVLALPATPEARLAHTEALVATADAPRAYGETLVEGGLATEVLERLAPFALASSVVELRRWTPSWLAEALLAAGFREARTTAHPGDAARLAGRGMIALGEDAARAAFEGVTADLGARVSREAGAAMVTAVR